MSKCKHSDVAPVYHIDGSGRMVTWQCVACKVNGVRAMDAAEYEAQRDAEPDRYHGPAVVVELIVGDEPEQGVEFEVDESLRMNSPREPFDCVAPHDGDCAPAAWGDGPMVCAVPLRASPIEPACPSGECPMCNGAMCNLCGAGCWNDSAPHCDHGIAERHRELASAAEWAPSPDSIPIRAGAPEAIGLTPRQLREQTAAAVAAEDALRDPEVTARNAKRLVERAAYRELTATEILDVADAVERGEVKLPGEDGAP